jgi:pilus assembly protein CpaF
MTNKSNPLDFLMELPDVTDIVVNGPRNVWIDRGLGMERVQLNKGQLETVLDVRTLALELSRIAGGRLDEASPILDAQLPGGARLHAVLSPIAHIETGALISLRIPSRKTPTLSDLVKSQMITGAQAKTLQKLVIKRKNIIISGATGSGKTTLLCSLISNIPKTERLICVEEAREVPSKLHEHLVFLTAKEANIENTGEVKLSELMRATLRMRPDRIILGECRGDEVKEFLMSLNTGHSGSITTIHANSAADVQDRLVTMGIFAGLQSKWIKRQFRNSIDAVIHIKRTGGKRAVQEIKLLKPLSGVEPKSHIALNPTGLVKMGLK